MTIFGDNYLFGNASVDKKIQDAITAKDVVYDAASMMTGNKTVFADAVTSGSDGTLTFYLTDNGQANGNALFTNVFKRSTRLWVDDAGYTPNFGNWTLSADKKMLTLKAKKQIVFRLQVLAIDVNLLTPLVESLPNGITVSLSIRGN